MEAPLLTSFHLLEVATSSFHHITGYSCLYLGVADPLFLIFWLKLPNWHDFGTETHLLVQVKGRKGYQMVMIPGTLIESVVEFMVIVPGTWENIVEEGK